MIIKKLTYNFYKTSLTKEALENSFGFSYITKAGKESESYFFNPIRYSITNSTIIRLNKLSNKAKDFIRLDNDIKNIINNNKEIKKEFDYFVGKSIKYDRSKFLLLFNDLINYDDYIYLSIDDIDTKILLEFFTRREEFENSYKYKSIYSKRVSNLRTDHSFYVFSDEELKSLETLIGKDYDIFSFEIELKKLIEDERANLVKMYSMDFSESTYIKDYIFPNSINEFDLPSILELPFSHLDSQPRYAYPLLANSVILPLTHRLPDQNYSYQQIELSTASCHTAYYFREATWNYALDKKKLNFDLFLNLIEDSDIYLKDKMLKKIIDLLNSEENSVVKLDKLKKSLKDEYKNVKDIVIQIYNLERLYSKDITTLVDDSKKILSDKYEDFIRNIIYIRRDLDIFGNPIPIFYIEKDNNEIELINEVEEKPNYKKTGFIVVKEMLDINGSKKGIDIDTVNKLGINEVLNNDIDFPIKRGFYDINTPKIVYYFPNKNNFIPKGTICYDGRKYYNWLKRTRVFYIPDFWIERIKETEFEKSYLQTNEINKDTFLIPDGRELSDLPALANSYILTPMNNKDKLTYFEKFSN